MKLAKLIILIAASAALLTAGIHIMESYQITKAPRDSLDQNTKVIEIKKGNSPKQIAALLESEHIISSGQYFYWLGKWTRQWGKIKAGEYEFSASMNAFKIFSILQSGISISTPVTIREGANIYEIAEAIKSKGFISQSLIFLKLCKSPSFIKSIIKSEVLPPSLEGYLYPETYLFQKLTSAEEMIKAFYKMHLSIWSRDMDVKARTLGFSKHQLLTLASMIEKETGAPQERPIISSVFYNRLKKKMRLQSDPTTIYGIWERYNGNIKKSDLLESTPYNTYTVPALPVGPIGNPGIDAIQAALNPAASSFLFFVSHNDGTHEFTKSYGEHTHAVQKFQIDPNARLRKSWRDLKKNPH